MIIGVNTAFKEMNHLAAELAKHNLLSTYVRPYANLGRTWERHIERNPILGRIYLHSIGRRTMPQPLTKKNITEYIF